MPINTKKINNNSNNNKTQINIMANDILNEYKNILLSNNKLFTIVQRNYNPIFIEAYKDLKMLGRIYNYKYEYNLKISTETTGWRANKDICFGGVLIDMGYHILDILIKYFGNIVNTKAIQSFCYNSILEDSISAIFEHKNGINGTMILNRHNFKKQELFEILGDKAIMEITPQNYKIMDRKGNVIKECNNNCNSDIIKLSMFNSYFNLENNNTFLKRHFEHHKSIVEEINYIYDLFTKNYKQII